MGHTPRGTPYTPTNLLVDINRTTVQNIVNNKDAAALMALALSSPVKLVLSEILECACERGDLDVIKFVLRKIPLSIVTGAERVSACAAFYTAHDLNDMDVMALLLQGCTVENVGDWAILIDKKSGYKYSRVMEALPREVSLVLRQQRTQMR